MLHLLFNNKYNIDKVQVMCFDRQNNYVNAVFTVACTTTGTSVNFFMRVLSKSVQHRPFTVCIEH